MLFDTTEGLHQMGILTPDKYITPSIWFLSIITTFLLAPLIGRVVIYVCENETVDKYIGEITISVVFGILLLMRAYVAILVGVILVILLEIIYSDPKYKYIRDYLERFF